MADQELTKEGTQKRDINDKTKHQETQAEQMWQRHCPPTLSPKCGLSLHTGSNCEFAAMLIDAGFHVNGIVDVINVVTFEQVLLGLLLL